MNLPLWLMAGWWGFVAGAALILGAAVAWFVQVPRRLIAAVMAFGSGVLISALSFDLMDEAFQRGGHEESRTRRRVRVRRLDRHRRTVRFGRTGGLCGVP